jgi:hypothetical protein
MSGSIHFARDHSALAQTDAIEEQQKKTAKNCHSQQQQDGKKEPVTIR